MVKSELFISARAYLLGQLKIAFQVRMNIVLPLTFSVSTCDFKIKLCSVSEVTQVSQLAESSLNEVRPSTFNFFNRHS